MVLPVSFGQLPHTSLRLLDHLVGVDARSADGGIGVGGSAIGRRGKGLALAILLITGGTKTARKSEVIGPASFAFCLADFGGHAAFGRRPLGERADESGKLIILKLKRLQTIIMGPQRLGRRALGLCAQWSAALRVLPSGLRAQATVLTPCWLPFAVALRSEVRTRTRHHCICVLVLDHTHKMA